MQDLSKLRIDLFNDLVPFVTGAQNQESLREKYFTFKSFKDGPVLVPTEQLLLDYLKASKIDNEDVYPSFGCPAKYAKMPNGEDLITVMHNWLSKILEIYLYPNLGQVLKNT